MADNQDFLDIIKDVAAGLATAMAAILAFNALSDGSFEVSLSSSVLTYAYYDNDAQTLTLDFVSGSRYVYFSVSRDDALSMVNAPSIGRMYNYIIRNDHSFQRLA
jgi:hypothetical protein